MHTTDSGTTATAAQDIVETYADGKHRAVMAARAAIACQHSVTVQRVAEYFCATTPHDKRRRDDRIASTLDSIARLWDQAVNGGIVIG